MDVVYSPDVDKTLFDPVQHVYLFYGEDDRQKDEALSQLQAATVHPAFADFDLEVLDAESAPTDRILASAGMVPFASKYRLVIVRGVEIYRRREKAGEAERLALGLAGLGSQTCLVLRAAAGEEDFGRSKTALTTKLDAAARAHGAVVRFKQLTPEALINWLTIVARDAGKKLTREAAEILLQAGRGDRTLLANELEKAICYAGDKDIVNAEAVQAVCSFDAEDVMFRLIDAVSSRNGDRALTLFRELLRHGDKPQSISGRLLSLLSRQFRLIWQARELGELGVAPAAVKSLPPGMADDLPADGSLVGMAWKAGDLFRMSRSWSRPALIRVFYQLMETDLANKGGENASADPLLNLELLILSLCAVK